MNRLRGPGDDSVTHIVYDPATGRVLGTMRHDRDPGEGAEDAGEHEGCHCHEDRTALTGFVERDVSDEGLPQIIEAPAELPARLSALRVDLESHRLLPMPHLVIDPERTVLDGDGEDTVTIEIRAVDERGAVLTDFTGDVHVQAGRGRLSQRGGTVRLEGGRATIRLTSVAETVDAVPVVVSAVDGMAAAARTSLAFE
jgi:hypothetical protein